MTSMNSLGRGISRALAIGAMTALSIGALPAQAQQQQAQQQAATAEPVLAEVVVTGSLIKRSNAETAEAVTVITSNNLKDMGITSVEQALQQIASNQATTITASAVAAYTGGGSFASLRGLGQSKTLVLLDGQRLANNVTAGNAVDLNGVPFAAIDHIEVLREGASSLYGTDAIAGVINFITKKDYDKGELNINFSRPQEHGGESGNADATWGKGNLASDGYNLMVSVNYTKQDELQAQSRAFAATGFDPARGLVNQNGPFGTAPGSYLDSTGNGYFQVGYPACAGNPYVTRFYNNCAYEYSAAVDLIPASYEGSGLISFTKALPANNTLSIQYFYTRSWVETWGGPQTYSFLMTPQNNPLYYPTAAETTCNAPNCTPGSVPNFTGTAFGAPGTIAVAWTDPQNNRYLSDTNSEQRVLVTFAGSNGGWDYSAALNYSQNYNTLKVEGGEANYALIAPGNLLNNLINPFGPQTAAGQSLINSAYTNGDLANGILKLGSLNGHATHELGDAFGAGRPAVVALGFDAQVQKIGFASTPLAATLYTATYYPPNAISGSRNEQAAYVELNVPVTKGFEFTVSDRQDRYSDFGDTNNAKLSLRYQPISELTFRGAVSTGFRAPSLVDLYSPNVLGATGGSMNGPGCPNAPTSPIWTVAPANCTAQGLGLYGGNTKLGPETSQNLDLGFVLSPIPDLGITVDYYHILVKNEIQTIPDQAIYGDPITFANLYVLNNAGTLTQAPFANIACPTPQAPTCGYIYQTVQNTGGIATSGFDLSTSYLLRTYIGKFRFALEGTLATTFNLQTYQGGPQLDLIAQFNQGFAPVIRWQHLATLDWSSRTDTWGAGISNRWLEHYVDEYDSEPVLTGTKGFAGPQLTVGNWSVWNVYGSWKPVTGLTLLLGIRNALNTDPPFSNQTGNWQAGYNPITSDPFGRTYYARVKYEF